MTSRPNIIYVGATAAGSTTNDRWRALEEHGARITTFDTILPYVGMVTRLERSLMGRYNVGRGIDRLNLDLVKLARSAPFDLVWVDKGVWIYPDTVAEIRALSRLKLAVHSTPDAQIVDNRSRHFVSAIPHYDLLVTTKRFELEAYRIAGGRDVLLIEQGHGRRFMDDVRDPPPAQLCSDIAFVGHCQPHYRSRIKALSGLGADLKVWGPRWPRSAQMRHWLRPIVQGEGLWGRDYPLALKGAKIALGLLGKHIPESTTTRTFEIPAAGTFMLAERTDDHMALFEEGREAEFFSSDEELCDKARHYLANDTAREAIARAGHERCIRSRYSSIGQLARVIDHLVVKGVLPRGVTSALGEHKLMHRAQTWSTSQCR